MHRREVGAQLTSDFRRTLDVEVRQLLSDNVDECFCRPAVHPADRAGRQKSWKPHR